MLENTHDLGKFKYDEKKEANRRKKNQFVIELKEVKFRPKVDTHDYDFKIRHADRFLSEGNKVKCTIMFRGREMAHTEIGAQLLMRVRDGFGDKINVEQEPRLEGRNMSMIISPKPNAWPKKKKGPSSDAEAKAKSSKQSRPAAAPAAAEPAAAEPATDPTPVIEA